MKKIVYATLTLAASGEKTHYRPRGRFVEDYEENVRYAINAFLAKTLKKEDDVKVVLIMTSGGANVGEENKKAFMDELNSINSRIGANIHEPVVVQTSFELEKTEFHKIFSSLVRTLEEDAHIYADCTYGHKAYPILLTSVLQFAEKYFNCNIENIIYGKVEFDKNKNIIHEKSAMYDFIALYCMSSLTANMHASSGEKAIAAIDAFFEM